MKHVADLEHSQALVDAGIVVESYFWWYEDNGYKETHIDPRCGATKDMLQFGGLCPAPLPCELMEILEKVEPEYFSEAWYKVTGYLAQHPISAQFKKINANALADMAIWLKKQGLLDKPKEEG